MGFLKKFGQIALKGLQIATGLTPYLDPILKAEAPQVADTLDRVVGTIGQIEIVGQALSLSGTQKLIAAAPGVEQVLLDFVHAKGWKIADEAKFKTACAGIASNTADLLNAIHEDAADSIDVKK